MEINVLNHKDIVNILIPFFNKHPIQGAKHLDFIDFCRVAFLMKDKVHLTEEGLHQIQQIKSGMNTNREYGQD